MDHREAEDLNTISKDRRLVPGSQGECGHWVEPVNVCSAAQVGHRGNGPPGALDRRPQERTKVSTSYQIGATSRYFNSRRSRLGIHVVAEPSGTGSPATGITAAVFPFAPGSVCQKSPVISAAAFFEFVCIRPRRLCIDMCRWIHARRNDLFRPSGPHADPHSLVRSPASLSMRPAH